MEDLQMVIVFLKNSLVSIKTMSFPLALEKWYEIISITLSKLSDLSNVDSDYIYWDLYKRRKNKLFEIMFSQTFDKNDFLIKCRKENLLPLFFNKALRIFDSGKFKDISFFAYITNRISELERCYPFLTNRN